MSSFWGNNNGGPREEDSNGLGNVIGRGQRNRRKRTLSEESKHPMREREAKELALRIQCIRVSIGNRLNMMRPDCEKVRSS